MVGDGEKRGGKGKEKRLKTRKMFLAAFVQLYFSTMIYFGDIKNRHKTNGFMAVFVLFVINLLYFSVVCLELGFAGGVDTERFIGLFVGCG